MKRFDKMGMMIYPDPETDLQQSTQKRAIVVRSVLCPNGHELISKRAMFDDHPGILLKVRQDDKVGYVGLSPVFGDVSKITFDYEPKEDEIIQLQCPDCDAVLPVYSQCQCGSAIVTAFTYMPGDYHNVIGICTRVGCYHSHMRQADELLTSTFADKLH